MCGIIAVMMIKIEGLYYAYNTVNENIPITAALSDVSFFVEKGAFVAIVGHNGSGKSTLARHINALLLPSQGEVWVNGNSTGDASKLWEVRKTAGMIFQNPDNQIVATLVEEDVAFGPENVGTPSHKIRKQVDGALAAVHMQAYAKAAPHHLSGGQKQRVAIAGVLAMRPEIIIADESTAMLDPQGRREVMQVLRRLNDEGVTVVLITHFMEEAAQAQRIIVMNKGHVAMDGAPQQVFAQGDVLEKLGLAMPRVAAFAQKLRARGVPVGQDVLTAGALLADAALQKAAAAVGRVSKEGNVLSGRIPGAPSSQPAPVVLALRDVSHVYNAGAAYEKCAIRNINLQFRVGEMTAIIGHTGSGKSTLVQHMNALLKPTSGSVLFKGEDIHGDKKRLRALRRRIGLVFQYPEHQLFAQTVYEDVAYGPTRMGLSAEEIQKNARAALAMVGLGEEVYEKSPFALSGGQKRRVAIAGVLAMQPEVLILDEPTAGLDPQGRGEILAQIQSLHRAHNITVLLISHSMDDAAALCNRIIVMNQGEIAAAGTPAEIFAQISMLEEIGLDVPQVARIMAQLAETNENIPTGIYTEEHALEVLT
ncbi:MAG: energy-coupling factor transporter ATPase [Defluviitaleaceae bacterium]|nr:energy-coupling factor transporter ATPase [Defluviitaleaceae bacterium]MCL2273325.1 energy-coupling factor transporter ATPase [Defluviitaleaceae bacterium]